MRQRISHRITQRRTAARQARLDRQRVCDHEHRAAEQLACVCDQESRAVEQSEARQARLERLLISDLYQRLVDTIFVNILPRNFRPKKGVGG